MDHFIVAAFLISHLLLDGCFLGSLKKAAHQEKIGLCLWASQFYLQLATAPWQPSEEHARELSSRLAQLPQSRGMGNFP